MTDGLPTTGERNRQHLAKIILEHKLENIGTEHFIGFGENHDSHLLETFAKIYDDNYHFIDSYEIKKLRINKSYRENKVKCSRSTATVFYQCYYNYTAVK